MDTQTEKPLPLHFYNARAWLKSLITHYTQTHHIESVQVLNLPLGALTRAIENVINIYGNFPETTIQFFKQTINPLFEPNEYHNTVYVKLKELAEKEDRPNFFILAESLLFIRRTFEKDTEFLLEHFSSQIVSVNKPSTDEQLDYFAKILHSIAKVHVNQVTKMIKACG